MAGQSRKGILAGMYGAGQDVAGAIAQDTSLPSAGFQDPPPGIKVGTGYAALDEVKVDIFKSGKNEGKPYFAFVGIICAPIYHTYTPTFGGKTVEGVGPRTVQVADMQTRIQIGIHDQKIESGPNMGKVVGWAEKAKEVGAQFRGLGFDTSKVRTLQDLEDLAERATKIARDPKNPLYFKFSTSTRKSQNAGEEDGAWQNWHGLAPDDYEPPSREGEMVDATEKMPGGATGSDFRGSGDIASMSRDDVANGLAEANAADDLTALDLDALLAFAKSESDDETTGQDELIRRAVEKTGKTEQEILDMPDMDLDGLVKLINGEGEEQKPKVWTKGEHAYYTPMVKGLGGKMKKGKRVECKIDTVNNSKKTVTLKSTVDNTVFKDVSWDELEDIS